jgi:hypothetical protein
MSEAAENLTNEVMSTCPICEKPVTRTDSRKLVGGTNVGGQHGVEMIDQQLAHTACADGEAPGGALFAATEPLTQPDEPAEEVSRLFDVEGIDPPSRSSTGGRAIGNKEVGNGAASASRASSGGQRWEVASRIPRCNEVGAASEGKGSTGAATPRPNSTRSTGGKPKRALRVRCRERAG